MEDSKSTLFQIVLALIGSSLVAVILTNLYSNLFLNAYIYIDDKGNNNITITNEGTAPAKNLTITIKDPGSGSIISKCTNIFSTEILQQLKLIPPSTDIIMLHIPRFSHGSGSKIEIDHLVDDNSNCKLKPLKSYSVYATHDGGSNKLEDKIDPFHYVLMILNNPNRDFLSKFDYVTFFLYVPVLGGLIFDLLFIYYLRKKRTLSEFIFRIKKEMLFIVTKLRENPEYKKGFFRFRYILNPTYGRTFSLWRYPAPFKRYSSIWEITEDDIKLKSVYDIKDYWLIDDFYKKVKKRQNLVSDRQMVHYERQSMHSDLNKLNKEIREQAERLLKEIDWIKYIEKDKSGKIFSKNDSQQTTSKSDPKE